MFESLCCWRNLWKVYEGLKCGSLVRGEAGWKLTDGVEVIQIVLYWKCLPELDKIQESLCKAQEMSRKERKKGLLLKRQWGTQTNTPWGSSINKLSCDRSCNVDLWLLLIILWTERSKRWVYATPGPCADWAQLYIARSSGRHIWNSPSNTQTHIHNQDYYEAPFRILGLLFGFAAFSMPRLRWGHQQRAQTLKYRTLGEKLFAHL